MKRTWVGGREKRQRAEMLPVVSVMVVFTQPPPVCPSFSLSLSAQLRPGLLVCRRLFLYGWPLPCHTNLHRGNKFIDRHLTWEANRIGVRQVCALPSLCAASNALLSSTVSWVRCSNCCLVNYQAKSLSPPPIAHFISSILCLSRSLFLRTPQTFKNSKHLC